MTQALYRRYRPESFADVIGQEHVTAPLLAALGAGKVNHAYLFSGPRGCGKTTSARILARCLNCAEGPTPTPCGTCPSCVELARGGSGSLDVVEIDAASHGGVDDARELRERATIGPARDRFKVYIIDEAHMVTPAGFNALLKLVEEPPDYVKFVFATTEPDKVLQTIRSRTHHYSFRLVPPDTLSSYLEQLCADEGVTVAKGVLPLVVRAGAGSVRDSLSVLDQLIAGSGPEGVDYPLAVSLLGYTDAALLDEVVSALGQADGAALFGVVDRVVQSGHDPRQFVTDLLERLRDLIVLQAMGEAAHGVLRAVPQDQLDRMRTQSTYLGAGELSRAADVVNAALTEMVGASSPRMHLELLCARLLLPSADAGEGGLGARLDRIERRLGAGAPGPVAAPARPAAGTAPARPVAATPVAAPSSAPADARTEQPPAERPAPERPAPERPVPEGPAEQAPAAERRAAPEPDPTPQPTDSAPAAAAEAQPGALDTDAMRRMWPDLLRQVQGMKRSTWMIISANAQVHELSGGVLRLAFSNQGTARGFGNGQHAEVVSAAVEQLLGVKVRVEAVEGAATAPPARAATPPASAPPAAAPPAAARPPAERPQPERTQAPPERRPSERPQQDRRPERPQAAGSGWDAAPPADEPPPDPDSWEPPPGDPWATAAPARPASSAAPSAAPAPEPAADAPARRSRVEQMADAARPERAIDDVPSDDDPDLDDAGPAGQSVVEEMLGGSVIDVEQR